MSEQSMPDVKQCPHCGGQPRWTHHTTCFDGAKLMSLRCCTSIVGQQDEVAAQWNKRLPVEEQRNALAAQNSSLIEAGIVLSQRLGYFQELNTELLSAAESVLRWRIATPTRGDLIDNDASRDALRDLAEKVAKARGAAAMRKNLQPGMLCLVFGHVRHELNGKQVVIKQWLQPSAEFTVPSRSCTEFQWMGSYPVWLCSCDSLEEFCFCENKHLFPIEDGEFTEIEEQQEIEV